MKYNSSPPCLGKLRIFIERMLKRSQVRFEFCRFSQHIIRIESLWILLPTIFSIVIIRVKSEMVNERSFLRYPSIKIDRKTATASVEEGYSAVDGGCEYGNFVPKQVTDIACCHFVVSPTFYIWLSYKFLFDYLWCINVVTSFTSHSTYDIYITQCSCSQYNRKSIKHIGNK